MAGNGFRFKSAAYIYIYTYTQTYKIAFSASISICHDRQYYLYLYQYFLKTVITICIITGILLVDPCNEHICQMFVHIRTFARYLINALVLRYINTRTSSLSVILRGKHVYTSSCLSLVQYLSHWIRIQT